MYAIRGAAAPSLLLARDSASILPFLLVQERDDGAFAFMPGSQFRNEGLNFRWSVHKRARLTRAKPIGSSPMKATWATHLTRPASLPARLDDEGAWKRNLVGEPTEARKLRVDGADPLHARQAGSGKWADVARDAKGRRRGVAGRLPRGSLSQGEAARNFADMIGGAKDNETMFASLPEDDASTEPSTPAGASVAVNKLIQLFRIVCFAGMSGSLRAGIRRLLSRNRSCRCCSRCNCG